MGAKGYSVQTILLTPFKSIAKSIADLQATAFGSSPRLHRGRHCDILFRDATGVMRGQRHIHLVVDVRPFGMVIHLFGQKRHARHEGESFVKICEGESPLNSVSPRNVMPLRKFLERGCASSEIEFFHKHSPETHRILSSNGLVGNYI